jgi:hypothetical protein
MGFMQKMKDEFKAVGLAALYFGSWIAALLLLKFLILAEYQIAFHKWSMAVGGALILSKVGAGLGEGIGSAARVWRLCPGSAASVPADRHSSRVGHHDCPVRRSAGIQRIFRRAAKPGQQGTDPDVPVIPSKGGAGETAVKQIGNWRAEIEKGRIPLAAVEPLGFQTPFPDAPQLCERSWAD